MVFQMNGMRNISAVNPLIADNQVGKQAITLRVGKQAITLRVNTYAVVEQVKHWTQRRTKVSLHCECVVAAAVAKRH